MVLFPGGGENGEYWSSFDADPKITGEGVVDTTWDFMPSRQEIQDKAVQAGYPENTAYSLLLDEGIKAIHRKVADLGLASNTLIIFMPDHGVWRHGKATLHDYGTKVPMFMYWKDSIVSGVDYRGLIQSIDFAPTILDIAGVDFEGYSTFDGMSLKHILKTGTGSAHESLFAELGYARSVKTKKWKYIAVRYPEDVQEKIDRGDTWTGFDGGILEFPYLTVRENLWLGGYHPGARAARKETLENVYSLFPRLRERESQQAYSLSGGEQQMLALGRGIMSRPKLLMVDEPFLGLSPAVVKEMTEAFMRIRDSGVGILFIEQNVQVALNMSERGYILESGRLVLEGVANKLLGSDEVKRIFLGG